MESNSNIESATVIPPEELAERERALKGKLRQKYSEDGVAYMWGHQNHLLMGKSPEEVFPTNPGLVEHAVDIMLQDQDRS